MAGRSMGSRAAVGLANDNPSQDIAGVICMSYPLHTEENKDKLRDESIKALDLPSVFISGTEDKMCDKEKLEKALKNNVKASIKWIDGADHSCKVKGRAESDVMEEINENIIAWCKERIKVGIKDVEKTEAISKGKKRLSNDKDATSNNKKLKKKKWVGYNSAVVLLWVSQLQNDDCASKFSIKTNVIDILIEEFTAVVVFWSNYDYGFRSNTIEHDVIKFFISIVLDYLMTLIK